ncbi:UvrB/UvrC motif-containing protein [candidate division WWE3 bacterium]|nr:UvrB/UvrC motif-containing protein [candidate division WWE3 bacterium]
MKRAWPSVYVAVKLKDEGQALFTKFMKIVILLHFYQPHNQQDDILRRIVNESYRPILSGLLARPRAKVVVNIAGSLTELLVKKGFSDVVDDLKELAARGQVELTGTAKYHAFLPLLPKSEIRRQIMINDDIGKRYFGRHYRPGGFFSPELAVNDKVLQIVRGRGFKWIAAPEISYGSSRPDSGKHYRDAKTGLDVFFRSKAISSLILSATVRTASELLIETRGMGSWFAVMDAETFGHHRIGHERLLFEIFDSGEFETCFVKEMTAGKEVEFVNLRPSTWTNQEQDFFVKKGSTYTLWKDPSNPIHRLQWKLADLAVKTVNSFEDKSAYKWRKARKLLDMALASDQFWWASAKPWWSLEMIEAGAYALREVVWVLKRAWPAKQGQSVTDADTKKGLARQTRTEYDKGGLEAERLYRLILDKAFEWQRTGYVRKKHLESSGTYLKKPFRERTSPEWFNQVVLEFEYEMNRAIAAQDFERAIKWRDALLKIKQGSDVYDVLHVVDELWLGRNVKWAQPLVKPFLQHEWSEFSDFAKSIFVGVRNKEEFERWKRS